VESARSIEAQETSVLDITQATVTVDTHQKMNNYSILSLNDYWRTKQCLDRHEGKQQSTQLTTHHRQTLNQAEENMVNLVSVCCVCAIMECGGGVA
jgi:hypothetical protein